ncbi:MAG: hypothetical protein JWP01_3633 [Myxococcales bacterium]|nr:hypothetical protein [Myxococcales bacterium]
MWSLRKPTPATLDRLLSRVAALELTYPEVGMSRLAQQRPGFGREAHDVILDMPYDEARDALCAFATHRLPYLFLYPVDARVILGANVIVCARIGPLWSSNPCRIVFVDETPDRFSYGYGTLPGHAESGEESFTVERRADGRVRAYTAAHARPDAWLARLGAPVAHRVQRQIKVDYMRALVTATSASVSLPSDG